MPDPIEAVFFDAGHTLVYAHPSVGEVYAEVAAEFGARVEPARFLEVVRPIFAEEFGQAAESSDERERAMWRRVTQRLWESLPQLAGVPVSTWFEALWERFGRPETWRLYGDVVPVLESLRRRGLQLGIISNWDSRLRGILRGLGLDRLVEFAMISAEVGVRKPDPRIFQAALERAGVEPAGALHVGDLYEEDALGARAVGMRAVVIDRGASALVEPRAWDVPTIVKLEELERFLGR